MNLSPSKLAIVIPVYKSKFFYQTLESIFAQTCQDFKLYIGDDCSPDPVKEVIRSLEGRRQLKYTRFEQNLGQRSLVSHWERCIALSNEPWVWLFSDDDMMEKECVEALLGTLNRAGETHDVFRFDTFFIGTDGEIEALNPIHPEWEGWMQFAYFWLRGLRRCTMPELVFSREAFRRTGGFVELPLAWGSDVATLIRLSTSSGITGVKGPRVLFRNSGENISSSRKKSLLKPKLDASMQFVEWLSAHANSNPDPSFPLGANVLHCLSRDWFLDHLERQHSYIDLRECWKIASFMSGFWGNTPRRNLVRLMRSNLTSAACWLHRRISSRTRWG